MNVYGDFHRDITVGHPVCIIILHTRQRIAYICKLSVTAVHDVIEGVRFVRGYMK